MNPGRIREMMKATQRRLPEAAFDFYHDIEFDSGGSHHPALQRLSQAPPIFWSESQGGYWVIRSHALAFEAAQATELFSSKAMNIPRDDTELTLPLAIPINLDPPEHGHFRGPLAAIFGPQRVAKFERHIRDLAIQLIDEIKGDGRCDFVRVVSEPLPVLTFFKMMGIDEHNLREFRELAIVGSVDPDPVKRKLGAMRVSEIMSCFVDGRVANPQPETDDFTTEILNIAINGRPVTPTEVKNYLRLLFFAGLDTVVNALAFGISYLARHPNIQEQLRANPAKIRLAVEELLRLGAPATLGRMVTRDALWHGANLHAGDRALLELPAANLDPAVFPEPLTFDIERGNIPHLAFNSGPHRCIGQHLARIELRVVYEEWLARVPEFRLDPAKPPKMHGGMVMGVDSLSLVWET